MNLENISDKIAKKIEISKKVESPLSLCVSEINDLRKKHKLWEGDFYTYSNTNLPLITAFIVTLIPLSVMLYKFDHVVASIVSVGIIGCLGMLILNWNKALKKDFSKLSVEFFNGFNADNNKFNVLLDEINDVDLLEEYSVAIETFKIGDKELFTKKMIEVIYQIDFDNIDEKNVEIKVENKKEIGLGFARNKLVKLI